MKWGRACCDKQTRCNVSMNRSEAVISASFTIKQAASSPSSLFVLSAIARLHVQRAA